ncbi:YbhN family protein [Microbispora sp. NPDC049125]|uniref:lysylphosphatidylglycerol synthase transmembrane domain-containing protein n=1 Tax=Microbispora sp. NPDC049125 TaxID=3154929 RepID=UPI00346695BB
MSRGLRWALGLGAAALAVAVLRGRLPGGDEVLRAVAGLDATWLTVAVAAEAMSMATFARLIRRLLAVGGTRVPLPRAVALTYARTAVSNSLPAGPVLSIAYVTRQLGRLGAGKPLITATLVLSGVYSTATFGVFGLVALLAEPATRTVVLVASVPVLAIGAALVRLRLPALLGWVRRRSPATFEQLRAAREAIRPAGRDRVVLTTLALANWALDIACLGAVCAAAGVEIGPQTILFGYVAAKLAAVLALVPGGLGVAEIGLGATFIAAGMSGGAAAAVVLLYRLISFWAVLVAGWFAWLLLLDGVRARLGVAGHRLGTVLLWITKAMEPCTYLYGYRDLPREISHP